MHISQGGIQLSVFATDEFTLNFLVSWQWLSCLQLWALRPTWSIASNVKQVASRLCTQANSAYSPQQDRKWLVAYRVWTAEWRPSTAEWEMVWLLAAASEWVVS